VRQQTGRHSTSAGPPAPHASFTLHVDDTQQLQRFLAPRGWNPGQPNVLR
jgi:hypothetical protein